MVASFQLLCDRPAVPATRKNNGGHAFRALSASLFTVTNISMSTAGLRRASVIRYKVQVCTVFLSSVAVTEWLLVPFLIHWISIRLEQKRSCDIWIRYPLTVLKLFWIDAHCVHWNFSQYRYDLLYVCLPGMEKTILFQNEKFGFWF